jgi:hypothetical protein
MPAFGTCAKYEYVPEPHTGYQKCHTHHNVYGTKLLNGELEQGHLFVPLCDVTFDKGRFPGERLR